MKLLKTILLFFLTTNTPSWLYAQTFHNLNFKQRCDSSKTGLCYWGLSWGVKGSATQVIMGNEKCLLIWGTKENAVGFVEQTSSMKMAKGIQIITVTAAISSEIIEGKGAGLNIGLYDKEENLLANKDMGGFYSIEWIKGKTAWKNYSISLICPIETAKIKIGAILYGKGKAWFKNYKVTFATIDKKKPSKLALKYISSVCDTIMKHSLVRDSVNIENLKQTAFKIAGSAKKYSDCYLAVSYLLESLRPYGDHHSFFMKPDEVRNWQNNGSVVSKIKYPSWKIINECGYILVPSFHGGNQNLILAYADSIQLALKKLENAGIKGWIIDLRENTGGNMEPMLAGLGPIFSSDKLGSLVDVNKKQEAWYYRNGKYFGDNYAGWGVSNPVILTSKLSVAVLTGNQTGSSGESVAISFIGNARTKFFGQPTWGLTTGNGSFDLVDGAKIFLASTIMADRNGKQYTGSIKPDIQIDDTLVNGTDMVIKAASSWIINKN
jgi:C-terminal processing protease CtpA/Prc